MSFHCSSLVLQVTTATTKSVWQFNLMVPIKKQIIDILNKMLRITKP